jgi:hypothetical protein
MDFRTQLVRTVAAKDDLGLGRLYDGVETFRKERPQEYAALPEPLRTAATERTTALALHRQWDARVKAGAPGPPLWPWWSQTQPSPEPTPEVAALTAKYRQCKRKVSRFEQWYAEYEALNRSMTAQLNEAHQLLTGTEETLALDEVAPALLRAAQSLASARTSTPTDA